MTLPVLKVQKIFDDAKIPCKPNTINDAGYDIYAYKVEKIYTSNYEGQEEIITDYELSNDNPLVIYPSERVLINCGVKATVDNGWEIQVRPRSGNALKRGLTILNTPGTIDSEYRGFIGCILINHSKISQTIKFGEAIAQIVPKHVEHLDIKIVENLDDTLRGEKGFGSTEVLKKFEKIKNKRIGGNVRGKIDDKIYLKICDEVAKKVYWKIYWKIYRKVRDEVVWRKVNETLKQLKK